MTIPLTCLKSLKTETQNLYPSSLVDLDAWQPKPKDDKALEFKAQLLEFRV